MFVKRNKMHVNLYYICRSLMFIILFSSCFLFYIVVADNATHATTETVEDASMAAIDYYPPISTSPATNAVPSEQSGATYIHGGGDENSPNENALFNQNKKDKILPNYKTVKKLKAEAQTTSPINNIVSDVPSETDKSVLSGDISEKNEEIKESRDKLHSVDENINSIENKNVFNTVEANERNLNENNIIHSSNEISLEKHSSQQVPNAELHDGQAVMHETVHDNADVSNGLPDITDIPTVTVTELPLEILQQPQITLDPVIIDDGGDRSKEETVNRTIEVIVDTEEEKEKNDQIVKINDSGGEGGGDGIDTTQNTIVIESSTADDQEVPASANSIPTDTNSISTPESLINNASVEEEQQKKEQNSSSTTTSGNKLNLTATEEVPMPVFSEWAQKQMEAAAKQQALEQEQTVNNSAQRKNNTNGNGKPTTLKIRAKNYASPDCGAKIIASSAYTSNAGAVLSSSKDEYMLSLCGNRIWFVVELCEAIQAQKIDFANFELYSSSPQNFTVAVSKRFPTREWSNVGRFEAEDKRAVQSFDLHPHLFGKFVRVDINSHYSKEHFCTLSLFRVFGTSEFEAFETENHPNEDLDDFDDEYLLEQNTVKHAESNLFKSASDAVLSIVKKASEVLGKPVNNQNQTFKTQPQSIVCRTPIYGLFSCADCPTSLVEKVNNILTCEFLQLNSLLSNEGIQNDLLNTRVCAKVYGIETKQVLTIEKDISKSFYVNILPNEYVGALCQLLATPKAFSQNPSDSYLDEEADHKEPTELPTNLTIDKKFDKEDLNLLDHPEKKLMKSTVPTTIAVEQNKPPAKILPEVVETSTEINLDDNQQLPRPLEPEEQLEVTTLPPKIIQKPNLPDTNIFNVPADEPSSETEVPVADPETTISSEITEQTETATALPNVIPTTMQPPTHIDPVTAKSEEDSNSWDNIEHLLTTEPSPITTGSIVGSGQYSQHKTSNGPQSESVFIRLSNRIKALERNMSLSGQYLEELSRRYKKQVEELQQTLTQQAQTVRTLEEENRRHHELEQLYGVRNTQLKDELDNLTLQVHACIVVIIFVGAFVFLVLIVAVLFYRSMRRETKEVLSLYEKKKNDATVSTTITRQKVNRRKSFEDFSDHQQSFKIRDQDTLNVCRSYSDKLRRPSEEAMLILKECKSDGSGLCQQYESETEQLINPATQRQRKMSVCYSSNNNINQSNSQGAGLPPQHPQKSQNKRKGEKHSWPNTAHAQLQAMQHLEELHTENLIGDSAEVSLKSKKSTALNLKSKKKKESLSLKRQQSSPGQLKNSHAAELVGEFDEHIILDEDDLDNFIPTNDLAYNEFMPDGPRGYQCTNPNSNANTPASKKVSNKQLDSNLKKSRRLSSPVFFKSPFTKSLKVGDLSKT